MEVEEEVGVSQAAGRQSRDEVPCDEAGKSGLQSENRVLTGPGLFHSPQLLPPECPACDRWPGEGGDAPSWVAVPVQINAACFAQAFPVRCQESPWQL